MVRLLVKFKDRRIKELSLDQIETVSIGRNSRHNLVIDNYAVSENHAVIKKEGNRYHLKDTGSKNGTFVNGTPIKKAVLKNGDVITIGNHVLVFLDRGRADPFGRGGLKTSAMPGDPGPKHTMFMESELYRKMLAESEDVPTIAEPQAHVVFLAGGNGKIKLTQSLVTIGRTKRCDIIVKGFFSFLSGDPAVTISKTPQHYYVNSGRGWVKPKVNGKAVRMPVRLKDMDKIEICGMILQFTMD